MTGAINVFGLHQKGQQFEQQKLTDLMDMLYKGALTEQAYATAERAGIPKDERTTAIKNYEYARTQGYKGSFTDFEKDARTTRQKEYEQAVGEGYDGTFHDWLRDITALGGGLNLEDYIARGEASVDIKSRASVTDPGLVSDIEKKYPLEDILFDYRADVDKLVADHGLKANEASEIVRKGLVRMDIDGQIRQAYRGKEVVWKKGKGWYVGDELIRRDPYATE